ncbi:hypothetical protein AB6N23_14600, partial [Cellulomonas sp. 179-A 9B4 NHS]|uniref:hypothetical protein n=1 Tax=Cellulomonas sp. 179-A 9B4 NHS TaxID=3142379 RepID=UPI00399F4B5C
GVPGPAAPAPGLPAGAATGSGSAAGAPRTGVDAALLTSVAPAALRVVATVLPHDLGCPAAPAQDIPHTPA